MSVEAPLWLARATGVKPESVRLRRMRGSTSATLYQLWDGSGKVADRFVLRLFTLKPWLDEEPDLARHEAAALPEAAKTGLPVPQLLDYLPGPSPTSPDDPVGFGAPAVLMSWLPGRVELAPSDEEAWLRALAAVLARVHAHDGAGFAWLYGSWVAPQNVTVPAWAADVALWEAAVEAHRNWRPERDAGDSAFLHRDFHPLNLLFAGSGGSLRVTGVVDWVNACLGPVAVDVAHCRMDLVLLRGVAAADRFAGQYRQLTGNDVSDPYWDLDAVFDMAVPEASFHAPWADFGVAPMPAPLLRARVEEFVVRAVAGLGLKTN